MPFSVYRWESSKTGPAAPTSAPTRPTRLSFVFRRLRSLAERLGLGYDDGLVFGVTHSRRPLAAPSYHHTDPTTTRTPPRAALFSSYLAPT